MCFQGLLPPQLLRTRLRVAFQGLYTLPKVDNGGDFKACAVFETAAYLAYVRISKASVTQKSPRLRLSALSQGNIFAF